MAELLAGGYGINPIKDVKTVVVPPPQMVANMRVGNMDGFCVGEPWNARAIYDKIGFTAATTQDIWKDHPEKVLGATADWVKANPNTARALLMAVLEASQYIDDPKNRPQVAKLIAGKATSTRRKKSSRAACWAITTTASARAGKTPTT
nr:CmpA/NrtA family ABC transporter substrate-binding protein [Methylogaea oryzae]